MIELLATFGYCVLSALVPFVNAEAYGGLRLPRLLRHDRPRGRWGTRLERWRSSAEGRPVVAGGLVLASAFVGVPPFAAVSALAGVVRHPVWLFVPLGLLGRYGRFACLLCLPGVWHHLVS